MNNSKVRRHIRITKDIDKTVRELSETNGIPISMIVERALRYFIENEGRDYKALYDVLNLMFEETREEIQRARMAVNDVKNDTQAIMQFWNDELLKEDNKDIVLIEENESYGVNKAKNAYQKELSKKRKKKLR
ncbi:MAG TPA: ribbon-helix-helix domain-containing protein [Virgibacillus sp.]|nr:ribbon-helix-helix domain-containing protein [Virgibacillus sp.]HLR66905.1 ribbon-helix-helix domain-containing protein [Virgibacillus sp.]